MKEYKEGVSQAAKISLETLRMSVKCAHGEEGSLMGARSWEGPWAVGNGDERVQSGRLGQQKKGNS